MVEAFSPGSDISEKILSSRALSSLDWSNAISVSQITYEKADVEEALKGGGSIGPRGETQAAAEDAHSLMAIPSTHVRLMTSHGYRRFCHKMNRPPKSGEKGKKWCELTRRLGMPQYEIPARDTATTANPTDCILQWWSRRSSHNKIESLLAKVKMVGHPEAAAVLEKELRSNLSIRPTPAELPMGKFEREEEATNEEDEDDFSSKAAAKESTLWEVAQCFDFEDACYWLAVSLDVSQGSDIISFLRGSNPRISLHLLAFQIMKTWVEKKGERATGEVLFNILHDKLKLEGVAEKFGAILLEA